MGDKSDDADNKKDSSSDAPSDRHEPVPDESEDLVAGEVAWLLNRELTVAGEEGTDDEAEPNDGDDES